MNPSAAAALLSLLFFHAAQGAPPSDVPENLKVPAGHELVLQAHATGSQIYVCQAGPDLAWTLKGPDANLFDAKGAAIGTHFVGPNWKHKDGSQVTGKASASHDAPEPDSVPWLLLTATNHSGEGIFSRVAFIHRLHTKGGRPPSAQTCIKSKLGTEIKVPYSADYYFYAPASH